MSLCPCGFLKKEKVLTSHVGHQNVLAGTQISEHIWALWAYLVHVKHLGGWLEHTRPDEWPRAVQEVPAEPGGLLAPCPGL